MTKLQRERIDEELDRFDQDRPFAVLGVESLRKVFFGTISDYGTLGGAIANPVGDPPSSTDASARLAERAGTDSRCAGAPGKTIVRTPRGQTKAVSFEQGWRIFQGERPGTLVVVCPD